MDELVILGCIVLFFALVVVPILAIVAINRTSAMRYEVSLLRRRLEELEQRGVHDAPEPKPVVAVEPVIPVAPVQPAPANPWQPTEKHEPVSPPERETSSAFGGVFTSLLRWFMQGNPLAKLGILLLFLGLSFLLRYTVEHALFPLELRLVATALCAVVLLAIGWRLRHKQRVYALILQGGATGVLYLTVFGAFRLWQMLPMTLAFALLVLICAASVGLAVLQNALSLAMLASLGGYLAPVLLSTGSGNYIALFSFYLLLSVGILAISARQHWRELNLLGLLFTFGVGGLWGMNDYRPEYWLNCQLFLIANILIFGVLSVLFSWQAQEKGKRVVDGVLLFAPPLIGFGMQYVMTQHMTYGPAISALGYGAFYLALAWLVLRRFPSAERTLVLAALALGGAFTTLAIPLALSARWTAMAWALEGVGVLWLGMQQQQRRMSFSGTALLLMALGSGVWALADETTPLSIMMIFAVISLCWLAAAWLWRAEIWRLSLALLIGGVAFWVIALAGAAQLVTTQDATTGFVLLALISLSAWAWHFICQRLAWRELGFAQWLLWPAMLLMLCEQIHQQQIFAAGWHNLAWVIALPSALMLLYRDDSTVPARLSQGLHLALLWMLMLAFGAELMWFVQSLPWGTSAWQSGLLMAAGGITILLIHGALRRAWWPFCRWPEMYGSVAVVPVVALLLGLLVLSNVQSGVVYHQLYLPLINPLEEGAAFALLGLYVAERAVRQYLPSTWRVALAGLAFWWLNGMLMRALAWYGDVAWDFSALWQSRLIQTTFALFWMLIALIIMIRATRNVSRKMWLCGAALLGVVIIKLMLVDSAGGGGLARAVAFIGVAILVLIVGYFSPLPPKAGEQK
ncbi:putative membrane protein [Enterobacteriaceae bacterium strain FGI 57]|nr:putative membrane protein [Enterobacteriaceae bacterium strain FGI 57]